MLTKEPRPLTRMLFLKGLPTRLLLEVGLRPTRIYYFLSAWQRWLPVTTASSWIQFLTLWCASSVPLSPESRSRLCAVGRSTVKTASTGSKNTPPSAHNAGKNLSASLTREVSHSLAYQFLNLFYKYLS